MSGILNSIHEDITALHECGAVDEITMRNFDALCLTPVPVYTPERIKEVREKNHISQSVLAAYLCVTVKAVQRWEQGSSKPSGATAKLLAIAEKKDCRPLPDNNRGETARQHLAGRPPIY